jgi:hypothetical protein
MNDHGRVRRACEAEDNKVETHRIYEYCGEDAIIGGGDDAPGCGDPFGFEEDTVVEEILMSDDWAYDVPVSGTTLRSSRHCVDHFIARPFMRSACTRAQPAKRDGCTASDSWNQRLGTHPCHLSRSALNSLSHASSVEMLPEMGSRNSVHQALRVSTVMAE